MKKIGIIGIVGNPSQRKTSHNAGWTYVYRSMLEQKYGTKVDILTHKDDWDLYDVLWINEGVNFRIGTWNLFGGVNDNLIIRLNKLIAYSGELHFWGDKAPKYNELIDSRKINLSWSEKTICCHKNILNSNKLVFGDSHTISVYQKGFNIIRLDGQTLHGALRDDLFSKYIPENIDTLRVYFGNIDIRHHICRIYSTTQDRRASINYLIDQLFYKLSYIDRNCDIEIVELLPIEHESRKLPKTGYYKGQPFYGDMHERQECVDYFNYLLEERCKEKGYKYLDWYYLTNTDLTSPIEPKQMFRFMEGTSSVHIAPHSYMFNEFIDGEREDLSGFIPKGQINKYKDQSWIDFPIQFDIENDGREPFKDI